MSDESSTDAPADDTPADDTPESEPTRPRRRRPQRSILILGGAAVVSAGAVAAAVLIAVQPTAKPLEYGRPPAPCVMVSRATLVRYLPNPTGTPVVLVVVSGNAEVEMSITDVPFSPTLSRTGKLAADIAMARDVLADLPR